MQKLFLYNTLSRKKEVFKPAKGKSVSLYTCGPTVYNYAHIGNLRTYVFEDVLRRTLKLNGYKVKQAMNITDIEDKIIKRAKEENKKETEISEKFTKIFFEDLKKLNIEKAEFYPKATANIKEMISLIKKLMDKGFAYQSEDGSVYFNVKKFKDYGKLSRLDKKGIKAGARVSQDEYEKEQAQDFVLWKAKKEGEPFWKSPWGDGRPGWHIECSAMSMKRFGPSLDIHAGGVDLIFPHHENEISQSEAATGKKFVRYWLHGEHLLVDDKKMSKSLGNFYALKDLEEKGIDPIAFRYLVLTAHYRSKLNFTWESLEAAQKSLDNLRESISKTSDVKNKIPASQVEKYKKAFKNALNDDLNAPKALAVVWKVLKDKKLPASAKKQLILEFDKVLGLGLKSAKKAEIPAKILELAEKRDQLRANKQFIKADALRKQIEGLGYKIEDGEHKSKITPSRH